MEPLGEAYSVITNPDRFRPLREWALETVARLRTEYEVALGEGSGMDPELERPSLSKPTLRLTSLRDSSAPIAVAFTDLPGLKVRVGRWVTDVFPSCACDACDEMPEEEFERFKELVGNVVAGRFQEYLRFQPGGGGWSSWESWFAHDGRSMGGGSWVPPARARLILNGGTEPLWDGNLGRHWGLTARPLSCATGEREIRG